MEVDPVLRSLQQNKPLPGWRAEEKCQLWLKRRAVGRRAALGNTPGCPSTCVQGGGGRFTVCLAALITRDVYWV